MFYLSRTQKAYLSYPSMREKTLLHIILTLIIMTASCGLLHAQATSVPQQINYQGKLTDALGNPLDGKHNLEFNIYDSATYGTKVWGPQTFPQQQLTQGYFNVMLGPKADVNDSPIQEAFFPQIGIGMNRYLEIKVNGRGISPRQQILSTPYAFKALHAIDADTIHGTDIHATVNDLITKYTDLTNRVNVLESRTRFRILAEIRVVNGSLVSSLPSKAGVTYDQLTGTITFPNPDDDNVFAVISDFDSRSYMTTTHYIREVEATANKLGRIKVWQTALDTSDRNGPPTSFVAIVLGYPTK